MMPEQTEILSDEQCDEFRRLPTSFNAMIRTVYIAGIRREREACAKVCDNSIAYDEYDPGGYFANLIRTRNN